MFVKFLSCQPNIANIATLYQHSLSLLSSLLLKKDRMVSREVAGGGWDLEIYLEVTLPLWLYSELSVQMQRTLF